MAELVRFVVHVLVILLCSPVPMCVDVYGNGNVSMSVIVAGWSFPVVS